MAKRVPPRPQRAARTGYLATAICFALASAAARGMLRHLKTRVQIIVYLGVAAAFELPLRRRLRQRPSMAGFLINAAAILVAVIAVKIAIDGTPHHHRWVRVLAAQFGVPI